jgi:cell division GTPase FtsZ
MSKVKVEKTKKDDEIKDDIGIDDNEEENKEEKLTADEILEKIKNKKMKSKEKKEVSLDFGVIGLGQAGSKLAANFYSLGYKGLAINTATQDLSNIKMPEENKVFLDIGIQGAAKDLSRGEEAACQYREDIYKKIDNTLGSCKVLIVCSSLGGGSGAGSLSVIIDLLQNIGKPIVVLAVLPMVSEDIKAKSNSLETLSKLSNYVSNEHIHNLIVVDNARIEAIYEGVSQFEFYDVANKAIIEPLDVFNRMSMKSSEVKSLDSAELATMLLNGEGLSIYGKITIDDYEDETAIAEAVFNGLEGNLLASGFDLKEARYVGFMVMANKNVWKKIPAGSINFASTMIHDTFGNPESLYKGIYESDDEENLVKVYSFASGLGLPKSRIDGLREDVKVQQAAIKDKDVDRKKKLKLDIGKDNVVSDVDKIKQRIASKKKGFGKLNDMVVDRRRK